MALVGLAALVFAVGRGVLGLMSLSDAYRQRAAAQQIAETQFADRIARSQRIAAQLRTLAEIQQTGRLPVEDPRFALLRVFGPEPAMIRPSPLIVRALSFEREEKLWRASLVSPFALSGSVDPQRDTNPAILIERAESFEREAKRWRRNLIYHRNLKSKYQEAARSPWRRVAPDPPVPPL